MDLDQLVARERANAADLAANEIARNLRGEAEREAARVKKEADAAWEIELAARRAAEAEAAAKQRAYEQSLPYLTEALNGFLTNESRRAQFGKMPMADMGTIRQELDCLVRTVLHLLDSRP